MPRIFELRTFLQSQNGWKYGISLDENVKTHPLIRPFKTLTEKVRNWILVTLSGRADFPSLGIPSDGQRSSGQIHSPVEVNCSGAHQWARAHDQFPRAPPHVQFFGSEHPSDGEALFGTWRLSQSTFVVHLQKD